MLNVHELVKLPHGEALKVIKQAGLWDEDKAGNTETDIQWLVTVDTTYEVTQRLKTTVWASDHDEVCEKAEDKVSNEYDAISAVTVKAEVKCN